MSTTLDRTKAAAAGLNPIQIKLMAEILEESVRYLRALSLAKDPSTLHVALAYFAKKFWPKWPEAEMKDIAAQILLVMLANPRQLTALLQAEAKYYHDEGFAGSNTRFPEMLESKVRSRREYKKAFKASDRSP